MPATHPIGPQVPLRVVRQMRGWTQEEVAQKIRALADNDDVSDGLAGTTHATISNVENGNRRPSTRLLLALARVFGIEDLDVYPGELRAPVAPGVPAKKTAA